MLLTFALTIYDTLTIIKMKDLQIFLFSIALLAASNISLAKVNEPVSVKKDTVTAYQILTDSTIQYDFGYACYYVGMPPKGRQAINNLIGNGDYEAIKSVLDGQNNEGKVYAIEALLTLNSEKKIGLTNAEQNKIKRIIENDLLIGRCQGCFVSSIGTIELFKEKRYKKLLKENKIEITKL